MSPISLLSAVACTTFLFQGAYLWTLAPRTTANRIFVLVTVTFAIWTAGHAFLVSAASAQEAWRWWYVSAIGWTVGPGLLLHFFLSLTGKLRGPRQWLWATLLHLPGACFLLLSLTGPIVVSGFVRTPLGWAHQLAHSPTTYLYVAFYCSYLPIGLWLVYRWGRDKQRPRERRQARTIVISGIGPLALGTVFDVVLPQLGIHLLPSLAPVLLLGWSCGIWFAISRHGLFRLTPAGAAEDIIDALTDGLLLADGDNKVIACNDAASWLLDRPRPELINDRLDQLQVSLAPPAPSTPAGQPGSRGSHSAPQNRRETVLRATDGESHIVAATYSPVRDTLGQPVGTIVLLQDLTDERAATKRLRDSEERFRELADLLPGAIFEVDAHGRFTYANRGMCELLGYTRGELLDLSYKRVLPENHASSAAEVLRNNLSTDQRLQGELSALRKDGSRVPVVVYGAPRGGNDGFAGLRGIAIDNRERKSMEDQLLQTSKMEAIGQLAGGVAHDFNNILTTILNFADLLTLDSPDGSLGAEAGEAIERAATRASDLTAKLLGFARAGKNQIQSVDLHELIHDAAELLRRAFDKNIELDLRLEAPVATVRGDPEQLRQVLLAIALNARDAMPKGGVVRLTSEWLGEPGHATSAATGAGQPDSGRIRLAVSDGGCGMDAATSSRVFEPFFSTKTTAAASGMGLAMAYGIIKNHDGSIELESTPGAGTTVTVTLPLASAEELSEAAVSNANLPLRTRVLVVDDEDMVRSSAGAILGRMGCEVMFACDGQQAVELFREQHRDIDVVLLDLVMPRMNGRDCMVALRRIDPQVRVILSTGFSSDGRVQETLDLGARAFVQKPYRLAQLNETISDLLQSS